QEWTARGTHEGPMTRSGIELEPTGKKVEYKGMDVIPIRDGLVARKDVYSDSITLLRQLGLTDIPKSCASASSSPASTSAFAAPASATSSRSSPCSTARVSTRRSRSVSPVALR